MGNIWILFLLFTVYSFLGWACESIYCSLFAGKFINRGFLSGPFCPVYGVGGILVTAVLSPLQNNVAVLYLAAVFLTSTLEYFTGLTLEKLFNVKYWDYSKYKINLHGRICLKNSLIFGAMSVTFILYINPVLLDFLRALPKFILPIISAFLIAYFITDTYITSRAMLRLNGKLSELQQVIDEIKEKAHTATVEKIEVLQATIADLLDEKTKSRIKWLYEKKDLLESGIRLTQRRLIKAFPTMMSFRYNESLQRIKEIIQSGKDFIKRG